MAGRPTAPLASASGHWLWAGGLCRLSSSFDFLLFLFSARRDSSSCLRRSRRSPPSALPLVCHREVDFIRSFCGDLRARALSRGPGAGAGPARGARVPRQAVVAVWESTPRASCSERTPLPRPHSGCCPHHSACLPLSTPSSHRACLPGLVGPQGSVWGRALILLGLAELSAGPSSLTPG